MKDRYIDRTLELCYLGYRGNEPTAEIARLIGECEELISQSAKPRHISKEFDIGACPLDISSERLKGHLTGCGSVILFASTLGAGIDALIRRLSVTDMTRAMICDACAGAYIERYCDEVSEELAEKYSPRYLTWRYAPGYEGFDISEQKKLIEALGAVNKIGLCANESFMLMPQKSITGIIGVSDGKIEKTRRGCAFCNMKDSCAFRKEGSHCGF